MKQVINRGVASDVHMFSLCRKYRIYELLFLSQDVVGSFLLYFYLLWPQCELWSDVCVIFVMFKLTWSTWKSSHVENEYLSPCVESLLFVQSIIPDSVDKTKIFTFSVFLKKTNKFTEREERAGTDCYHTHHITTIAADNCGFLLKIEHTRQSTAVSPDSTQKPVRWW